MGEEVVENSEVLRKAAIADVRSGTREAREIKGQVARANTEDSLVVRVIRAVKLGFDARSIRGQMKGGENDVAQTSPSTSER